MTGIPSALSAVTSDPDAALRVVSGLVGKSRCIGDVVGQALFVCEGDCVAIVDPVLSRVIATEHLPTRSALLGALNSFAREATLQPTGEREGRVLLWERATDDWGSDAIVDQITEPQRIPRSVGAVVNKLATSDWSVPFMVVDQVLGVVRLVEFSDSAAASAALSAVTPQGRTFAVGLVKRSPRGW